MKSSNIKGITIKIGGETSGLDKALKQASSAAKSCQDELRGINTLLKNIDPKNTQLLAQKQQVLGEAIGESRNKLKALKEMQDKFEAAGLDKNTAEYRDLEREIIYTESNLKELVKEQKKLTASQTSLGKLSTTMGEFGTKCEAAGQKLMGLSTAAAAVEAGLVAMAVKAGATADDINTMSKITGLSTEYLQEFAFATDLIDVSLSDMSRALAKNIKSMSAASKGTGSAYEAYKQLGISVVDSSGNLRDSQTVFLEVVDALSKMENTTHRDALAFVLFGKSAQNLNPLIEGGADQLEELTGKMKEMGIVLDQETLDKANAFNDQLDLIKGTASQSLLVIGASLSEVLGPALDGVAEKIANFANWFANLSGPAQTAILAIVGLVAALGPALVAIGEVSFGIQALAGAMATLRTAEIATTVATYAQSAAMAVKVGAESVATTVTAALTTAQTALNAAFYACPLVWIIALVVALVAAFVILWKKSEKFRNFFISAWNSIKAAVVSFWSKCSAIFGRVKDWFDSMRDAGRNLVTGLWQGITDKFHWLTNKIESFATNVKEKLKKFFKIKSPSRVMRDEVGKYLALGIGEGFVQNIGPVVDTMQRSMGALTTPKTSTVETMSNAVASGLAVGGSGGGTQKVNLVVNLGGAKVAEQVYLLNKQGTLAMEG